MTRTQDVLDSHIRSFLGGDLDGILADYAPDAVLFTPDGPLRGTEGIRPLFAAMLAEFGKPGARFKLERSFVDGEHAFILWTAETADRVYELGTDTFVVRNGKIAVQSFASSARLRDAAPGEVRPVNGRRPAAVRAVRRPSGD